MHRWSGWPGAWCLDCGIYDATELCVATHNDGILCIEGHVCCTLHAPGPPCSNPDHINPVICPYPNMGYFDPYLDRNKIVR